MIEMKLWTLTSFFGVIVPTVSGIRYEQQAGGTLCSHPSLEGAYLPLGDIDDAIDAARRHLFDYAGSYDEALVETFLENSGLDNLLRPMNEVDVEAWLAALPPWFRKDYVLFEAWVPTIVTVDDVGGKGLIDRAVVLVYPNSD